MKNTVIKSEELARKILQIYSYNLEHYINENNIDYIYTERELREKYSIKDDESCVDGLLHFKNCNAVIVEIKGKDVRHAIRQIEYFNKTFIQKKGYNIERIIIVCSKLTGYTRNKKYRLVIKKVGEVKIKKIPVHVVYKHEKFEDIIEKIRGDR